MTQRSKITTLFSTTLLCLSLSGCPAGPVPESAPAPASGTAPAPAAPQDNGGVTPDNSPPAPDNTPPSQPGQLSAQNQSFSQIQLTWTAASDDTGVQGYTVSRNGQQIGSTTQTSYTDAGLSAATAYAYTVSAYDAAGNASAASLTTNTLSLPATANTTLTAIAANTALDLGALTSNQIGDVCGVGSVLGFTRFTYDSNNHQMLLFGGGHGGSPRTDVMKFDLGQLIWSKAYAGTPISAMTSANLDTVNGAWISTGQPVARHSYDLMPFAPNTGELILLGGQQGTPNCLSNSVSTFYFPTKIAHYNPITKLWRFTSAGDFNYRASEYDPVSGNIVVVGSDGLYTYNPVTSVRLQHLSFNVDAMGVTKALVYYPPNQKMYYLVTGASTRVWEVTLNRSNWAASTVVEMSGISGNLADTGRSAFAYDPVNQVIGGAVRQFIQCRKTDSLGNVLSRTVEEREICTTEWGGAVTDQYAMFSAFNPVTKTWTQQRMNRQSVGNNHIGSLGEHFTLDYDPINQVFLFVTGDPGYYWDKRTWAYRYTPSN